MKDNETYNIDAQLEETYVILKPDGTFLTYEDDPEKRVASFGSKEFAAIPAIECRGIIIKADLVRANVSPKQKQRVY